MMPIAVLPAAGLLLRFGQPDILGKEGFGRAWDGFNQAAAVCASAGGVLFDNLPLLFAVGIAIGSARKSDGSTALAAVVGFLIFDKVFAGLTADKLINNKPPTMGVLSGILMGITTALLYQKFYRTKLPAYLAFFGGRRLVPILTAFAALALGVLFGLIWPPIGEGINSFGEWIISLGALGAGVYGFVNRLLIPFGLHHIINSLMWFVFGDFHGKSGDLNRFFAGDPHAGTYMAGFFPIMMFGLPAAALAIWQEARPEKRALIGGIMFSGALCSFLTGVTEPLEFAFLFVAPLLFVVHALLTGASLAICAVFNIRDGFTFSAGGLDFILNWNKAEHPEMIIVIGLVYAVIYYGLFRALIRFFNLMTPGRERDDSDLVEAGVKEKGGRRSRDSSDEYSPEPSPRAVEPPPRFAQDTPRYDTEPPTRYGTEPRYTAERPRYSAEPPIYDDPGLYREPIGREEPHRYPPTGGDLSGWSSQRRAENGGTSWLGEPPQPRQDWSGAWAPNHGQQGGQQQQGWAPEQPPHGGWSPEPEQRPQRDWMNDPEPPHQWPGEPEPPRQGW
jgi:PTS system N-acetylglucosamine-specific IIC component